MSEANALWGAPRIHGELQKLGLEISQATVSKYMACRRTPPSQTWRTFLDHHVGSLVSVDFFTVPTVMFKVLFVFVVLAHDRRRVLHINVTDAPTAPLGDRPARPCPSPKLHPVGKWLIYQL
jgi:putative transposase